MEAVMKKSRVMFAVIAASILGGCATVGGTEYVQIYDRKYNETRLVEKKDPGSFVGTSAVKTAARPAGQHL
jgi:hypothetical protein